MFPGGAREFFLSDDNYSLVWISKGFARVAIAAKCRIIPVFTKNTRAIHGYFKFNTPDEGRKQFEVRREAFSVSFFSFRYQF